MTVANEIGRTVRVAIKKSRATQRLMALVLTGTFAIVIVLSVLLLCLLCVLATYLLVSLV